MNFLSSNAFLCLKVPLSLENIMECAPLARRFGMWREWRMESSRLWRHNQETEFCSQMEPGEGMVIGPEAAEGSRRVIHHFSLGRSEDVTRIHTEMPSYPCWSRLVPGVVLVFWEHANSTSSTFPFVGFCNVRAHSLPCTALTASL